MKKIFKKISTNNFLYILVLVLVVLAFLIQAVIYAHQMPSRVDEGSFLIKGYYYVKGVYKPFQDYGPWTNNMPLAYYVPGLAQVIFGPGLRTGRYLMVFFGLLMLLGMGLTVHRLRGKWWALAAIAFFALNPALIKIYVQAVTQGIVACILTWVLFFLIGEKRSPWQIAMGAFLCALATLTRQNMVFLLPFVIIYAFHLYGKRAGWMALIWSAVPVLLVHAIFFPKILTLWTSWLPIPYSIKAQLGLVVEGGGQQVWSPDVALLTRFTSFFTAVRYYFVPFLGVILGLVFLFRKSTWRSVYERKLSVYLSVLFSIMFLMHAWASLMKDYCVYCFPNYLAFFISIAVILAVLVLSNLQPLKIKINVFWSLVLTLAFIPGAFLGSLETVGRWVMKLPVPRFKGGKILPGSTELWKLFENRFGFTYDQLLPFLATAFGLALAVLLLMLVWAVYKLLRNKPAGYLGNFAFSVLVILGFIFMPSPLLASMQTENVCGGDVLAAYEVVGKQLDDAIPAGSSVYWAAGSVVTPLLYITDTSIPAPILNGVYSKRVGGNHELLEKSGYYNQDSVEIWRSGADYVINSNSNMVGSWLTFLNAEDFDEYNHTDPLDPCDETSYLRIFKPKK